MTVALRDRPSVIAIDWSGARHGARRKIWLAEVRNGAVVRLEPGRDREAVAAHLMELATAAREMIVGLDFAFSVPAWYLEQHGLGGAPELWELAAREGERWLGECVSPFWGRPGRKRPELAEHFRATERTVGSTAGTTAKSVFQIGGAGAVGTGSIRGMPVLAELRRAGFAIWPFDAPTLPLVVEIYPRVLTGPVVKSSASERRAYLGAQYPQLDERFASLGSSTEDAFDALVSALVMDRYRDQFAGLTTTNDPAIQLEGMIWSPGRPA